MKLFQFGDKRTGYSKQARPGTCPSCGFVSDRPHVLYCLRCKTEIPGATGCSGCGKCRKNT